MGVERRLKGSKPRGGGILLDDIIDDSRDDGNEEHQENFQRESASSSRVSQFPLRSERRSSIRKRSSPSSMASLILLMLCFLVAQNNIISMHRQYLPRSPQGWGQSTFMPPPNGVQSQFFANNTQGSIPNPTIRHDMGPLLHKPAARVSLGEASESCSMVGDRVKHIVNSSAASLLWEADVLNQFWEVRNIRKRNPKNNYIEMATKSTKQIVGKSRGAEDHRVVLWRGTPIVIYHSYGGNRQMWLYDPRREQAVMLTICGHSTQEVEKNWTPLAVGEMLLLVYSIDPLIILQYDIDAGDGVCKLIFGHLPIHNTMREPYGGTPFKEISFSKDTDVNTRSFLSFAHSRTGNDMIPKDRQYRRVYRPVPVVLHMFCPIDEGNNDGMELQGCTFGVDVYDMWHEIQSPKEVFESEWNRLRADGKKSVSYPYDLHVFEQAGLVRVGIGYEDCFSVYEDYLIDFEAIRNQRHQHPIRLELEKNINERKKGYLPRLQQSAIEQHHCPAAYSHPGEITITSPMASETELAEELDGEKMWIVSHGGVSSERFRNSIYRQEKKAFGLPNRHRHDTLASGKQQRPMKGVLAHFPYPVQNGQHAPKLCVYIYGSVYEAIISQLRRHPLNAMKLHNDEDYYEFYTLGDLLRHPDQDPFGIKSQFENFLTANVSYPILLVRYDIFKNLEALNKLETVVSELDGNQYNFTSLFVEKHQRKSTLESITNATLREQFVERYSELSEYLNSQPLIRLLMPNV